MGAVVAKRLSKEPFPREGQRAPLPTAFNFPCDLQGPCKIEIPRQILLQKRFHLYSISSRRSGDHNIDQYLVYYLRCVHFSSQVFWLVNQNLLISINSFIYFSPTKRFLVDNALLHKDRQELWVGVWGVRRVFVSYLLSCGAYPCYWYWSHIFRGASVGHYNHDDILKQSKWLEAVTSSRILQFPRRIFMIIRLCLFFTSFGSMETILQFPA